MTANLAIDRDIIVIVEGDQLAELHRARERTGFVRNPFHQTAITQEHIGVVVNNLMAFTVELASQCALCNRHTYSVSNTLPERTRRRLNTRRITILGMTRRLGMQLAETLQFLY